MVPCEWHNGTQKIHINTIKINKGLQGEGKGSAIMLGFKLNLGSPFFH